MLTANDARSLAEERLVQAVVLLDGGHFSGAYYLVGYALELGFKAVIAKRFVADVIPDKALVLSTYSHDLKALLTVAQLSEALAERLAKSDTFAQFWSVAQQWSESSRYAMIDREQAKDMVNAVADPDEGVFAWLKTCF